MMTMNRTIKSAMLVLVSAFICALTLGVAGVGLPLGQQASTPGRDVAALGQASATASAVAAPGQQASTSGVRTHTSTTQNDGEWTWKWKENGVGLEVVLRGKVEFTDDYSDITAISPGGSLVIKDERGGGIRKIEITQSAGGGLKRSYSFNGEPRPFDTEARAWFTKILFEAVRQAGFDARNRARKILNQSGPNGVLNEISEIKSDYVKRLYFDELLGSGNVDSATARRILSQAARELSSDYEKASVLTKVAESFLSDDDARTEYANAVATIRSSYERGRALSALLKQKSLRSETLLVVLKSAEGISSDYEKAQVLVKVADGSVSDEAVGSAFVQASATIRSDYERARALSALLGRSDLHKSTLMSALKSAAGINSDYEKARVLVKVALTNSADEGIRNALIDTARTIRSEYERGRVLNAVFK
jgi:hypothetical protein